MASAISDATTPVHFHTPRLLVRDFSPADVDVFAAYRSDPDVARYQSWSGYSLERGRAFIESLRGAVPGVPGQWHQFALETRDNNVLIGDIALRVSDSAPSEAEVGFTLAPDHQGSGYGTEAVRGLLDYAFGTLGIRRATAITDARNAPAAALLERAGFRLEAHFKDNVFFKGAWGSEFSFAILEREWAALQPPKPRRVPRALREVLTPWIEAADGDEDRALDLLHTTLRERLAETRDDPRSGDRT